MKANFNALLCLLLMNSGSISIGSEQNKLLNAGVELNQFGAKPVASIPNYGSITQEVVKTSAPATVKSVTATKKQCKVCIHNCCATVIGLACVGLYVGFGLWTESKQPIYDCQNIAISQCGPCGPSFVECMSLAHSSWQGPRGSGPYVENEQDYINRHCPDAQISHKKIQCRIQCKDKRALSYLEQCSPQKAPQNSSAHKLREKIKALQDQRHSKS